MNKKKFFNEIRYNFKKILDEYINNRPVFETIAFPAEVVDNGDNTITMTFTRFPKVYAWYVKADVQGVLFEAMSRFVKCHKCKEVDWDEMWNVFEETYDYEWDINLYDNLCDNTLKVVRKLPF